MHTPPPCCPRCEYNLTGEADRWQKQCPLEGICPECGLALQWRDVYQICNEWGSEVGWYAEHAHRLPSMLRRTPATILRLVFPSWFFRDVHFRRVVRLRSLLIWLILIFAVFWLGSTITAGMAQSVEGAWSLNQPALPRDAYHWYLAARDLLNALSFPYAQWFYHDGLALQWGSDALRNSTTITYGLIPFVMVSLFWLVIVLLVPGSRRHAMNKPRLLIRGVTLGFTPLIVLIPATRILTAIYVYRGWRMQDEWIMYAELLVWVYALFWQQCIWTAFIRWGMGVRPSWYINLPGFFASLVIALFSMIWFLM